MPPDDVTPLPGQPAPAAPAPAPAAPAPAPAAPAPAPAAPAPAPAAPAAPAVPSLDAAPAPAAVDIPKTDNAVLGLAYKFFAKAGVGADAFKAVESGDFSKVKEALKANPDAAEYIAAAEAAHKSASEAQASKGAAIQAIVESVAGGKDQWNAARDWAAGEASEQQRTEINAALRAGGLSAKLAAQYIVGQYAKRQAGKTPVVVPNAAAQGAAAVAPLSPAEFQREVANLTTKGGSRVFDTAEYKALEQRRLAYRGR